MLQRRISEKLALEASFSRFDPATEDSDSSHLSSTPKQKIKTRGLAGSTQDDFAELDQQPIGNEDVQRTFTVDQRAQKVFKNLFFTPNLTVTPGESNYYATIPRVQNVQNVTRRILTSKYSIGEIPWIDFLHAMASTGFFPEKLYGSVWQFTPTRLDVERSINFHEPHPHSKTPNKIARCMGRRMDRAYGWQSGMFVTS